MVLPVPDYFLAPFKFRCAQCGVVTRTPVCWVPPLGFLCLWISSARWRRSWLIGGFTAVFSFCRLPGRPLQRVLHLPTPFFISQRSPVFSGRPCLQAASGFSACAPRTPPGLPEVLPLPAPRSAAGFLHRSPQKRVLPHTCRRQARARSPCAAPPSVAKCGTCAVLLRCVVWEIGVIFHKEMLFVVTGNGPTAVILK